MFFFKCLFVTGIVYDLPLVSIKVGNGTLYDSFTALKTCDRNDNIPLIQKFDKMMINDIKEKYISNIPL